MVRRPEYTKDLLLGSSSVVLDGEERRTLLENAVDATRLHLASTSAEHVRAPRLHPSSIRWNLVDLRAFESPYRSPEPA